MAKKEAKTDLWVARQLDDSKIKYDAQGSDVKEINDALQSASKRGTGNAGYPEYVAVVKDFVIVIEDKADLAKHQKLTDTGILSTDQKDIADYAVNGAYFYAKHIAQNSSFHKIFAIGVSGDEKHHKSTILWRVSSPAILTHSMVSVQTLLLLFLLPMSRILMIRSVNLLTSVTMVMKCVLILDLLKEIPLKTNVNICLMFGTGALKQHQNSVSSLQ